MRKIDRIEIKINGSYVDKDNRNAGVQYESNVKELRIEFDESWDGYSKSITFWNALMSNPVKRLLGADLLENPENNRIYIVPIPGEAMTEPGDMTFVIDGYEVESFGLDAYLSIATVVTEPTRMIEVDGLYDTTSLIGRRVQVGEVVTSIASATLNDEAQTTRLLLEHEVSSVEVGYKIYPADGKRKRSVSDTLHVIEAPFEEEADEPFNPIISRSQQLLNAAELSRLLAQQYSGSANNAMAEAHKSADLAVTSAQSAAESAQSAKENAEYVIGVLEKDFVTTDQAISYAEKAAEEAVSDRAKTTGDIFTGDVEIKNNNTPALRLTEGGATGIVAKDGDRTVLGDGTSDGINAMLSLSAKNKSLSVSYADSQEYKVYTEHDKPTPKEIGALPVTANPSDIGAMPANATAWEIGAIPYTGGEITGALTFNNPSVFSAIAKKRTVGDTNYVMRMGVGSDGATTTVSLRLFTVNQSGTESPVAQLDIDNTGVYWTPNGGNKRTIAHSGNLGLLTASVG